eukprot:Platyproteum_vivax@DN4277_c0_g1_i1.p1
MDIPEPIVSSLVKVFDRLKIVLGSSDIDQEVKECALKAFGHLMACLGDLPQFQASIKGCLTFFLERIKNEATCKIALTALKMAVAGPITIPLDDILAALVQHLSSKLSHQTRLMRQICFDVLVAILQRYKDKVWDSMLEQLVRDASKHISDTDLHISDLAVHLLRECLLVNAAAVAPTITELGLPAVILLARSPVLQGNALQAVLNFFAAAATKVSVTGPLTFDLLFSEITDVRKAQTANVAHSHYHVVAVLAQCAAQVVLNSDEQAACLSIQQFLDTSQKGLKEGLNADARVAVQLAVLALGEAGKNKDMSLVKGVEDTLLSLLNSPYEEVRHAAALAFGYASVGAMTTFLKILVDRIADQKRLTKPGSSKTHYLLLTSLREVIAQHHATVDVGAVTQTTLTEHLKPHVGKVLPVLLQYSESAEESDRSMVAECLGQLMVVDPQDVGQVVEKKMFICTNAFTRATAAAAIRYACSKHCPLSGLESLKPGFLHLFNDDNIGVRRQAYLSVQVAAMSAPDWLREESDDIVEQVCKDTVVIKELVREVDLGPFKHKVDDGLPCRKAAFQAMSALLSAYSDRVSVNRMVETLLRGLADQEDLQVMSCGLLIDLCRHCEGAVIGSLDKILELIDKTVTKLLKAVNNKQEVDRSMEALRLYMRTLKAIEKILTNTEAPSVFVEMTGRLNKDHTFAQLWKSHAPSTYAS